MDVQSCLLAVSPSLPRTASRSLPTHTSRVRIRSFTMFLPCTCTSQRSCPWFRVPASSIRRVALSVVHSTTPLLSSTQALFSRSPDLPTLVCSWGHLTAQEPLLFTAMSQWVVSSRLKVFILPQAPSHLSTASLPTLVLVPIPRT